MKLNQATFKTSLSHLLANVAGSDQEIVVGQLVAFV